MIFIFFYLLRAPALILFAFFCRLAYTYGDWVVNICGNVSSSACSPSTPICNTSTKSSWGKLESMKIFTKCTGEYTIGYTGGDTIPGHGATSVSITVKCKYGPNPGIITSVVPSGDPSRLLIRMESQVAC